MNLKESPAGQLASSTQQGLSLGDMPERLNLHFAHYNFYRIHGSLRMTPAMKAGITGHIWSIEEILDFEEKSN